MQNKKAIIETIEFVGTMKSLAQAYEEISALRMQEARSSVLSSRAFMEQLAEVYHDVRLSFEDQIRELLRKTKKDIAKVSFATGVKNGKEVAVLLSSSGGLYGDIIHKVCAFFVESTANKQIDIVIIGRTGKYYYEQFQKGKQFHFVDLPDQAVSLDALKQIVQLLTTYETVTIYFGKFENVVLQMPTASNISGQEQVIAQDKEATEKRQYDFEPSFDTIYAFFENQVFFSLFKQAVHESELARLASRIKAMEEALENIQKTEQQLVTLHRRWQRSAEDKKQLERIAGMSLWGNNR